MNFKQCYLFSREFFSYAASISAFLGIPQIMRVLYKAVTEERKKVIARDLEARKAIGSCLEKFISTEWKRGVRDFQITLKFYQSYFSNAKDAGLKKALWVIPNQGATQFSGFISRTGINLCETLDESKSLYIDSKGIHFTAKSNCAFRGFEEIQNVCLISHLRFHNISNVDFEECIVDFEEFDQCEPIIYVNYQTKRSDKLFCDEVVLRKLQDDSNFQRVLNGRMRLETYSPLEYRICSTKNLFRNPRSFF